MYVVLFIWVNSRYVQAQGETIYATCDLCGDHGPCLGVHASGQTKSNSMKCATQHYTRYSYYLV